ncbi:hypothetical protein A374_00015 [Fictibacillus macauensis ZFHKF-1]|uniref:Uncharacterized protein n=1 Tax=Fictibacillus macauensis ZFHKF-1 TaxID=1196324 RepID=I8UKT3_9BACL|nr:hypothetical protein [Fictibacillus macauensis]EIT87465.1 hypothetical protein A374_00015 [Fictibacillus macauensis ZFHKF-1]
MQSTVRAQEALIRAQEAPIRAQETPIRAQSMFVRAQEALIRAQEAPIRAQEVLVRAQSNAKYPQQPQITHETMQNELIKLRMWVKQGGSLEKAADCTQNKTKRMKELANA